ncbi:MAG TPA: ABC transporter ATP-binding protein [Pyrinomonadaceae bacterium]|nr:ABC transporter ATP-binding protein [Pyrinomonadaceae bacterium]
MTELLEARAVSKTYHMGSLQVMALHALSLTVRAGEFIAIQGASGSGKSTLLNLIGGLDRPTTGEILFEGKSIRPFDKKQLAHYRRYGVGMIFQNFNLIPSMTAVENVNLALAFGGVSRGERNRRAQALLARVGLSDRLTHRPSELSGGEQQRVAIARALANGPRLLLADEPTGNLDSTRAEELLSLLREMIRREALTVVMVTHDKELAARFADRIIIMKDGRAVAQRGRELQTA